MNVQNFSLNKTGNRKSSNYITELYWYNNGENTDIHSDFSVSIPFPFRSRRVVSWRARGANQKEKLPVLAVGNLLWYDWFASSFEL